MPYVRPTRMGQAGRWVAAIVLLTATPVLTVVAWRGYREARLTAGWPTVQGEIVRVQLRDVGVRDGYRRYEPDVRYVYRVGGLQYTGTRVRAVNPYQKLESAREVIAGMSVGQSRTVYYDPADPAKSLLMPGAVSGEVWMLIAPLLCLAGGVAVVVWLLKNRGRRIVRLEPP